MKYLFALYIMLLLSGSSCKNQQDSLAVSQQEFENLQVEFDNTILADQFQHIDFSSLPQLSKEEFEHLQIDKIQDLRTYDPAYLFADNPIFSNDNGKIIVIRLIANGEIAEYLVSYDKNENLIDNLNVSYEDLVEYYSHVSSKIENNYIIVKNVEFYYSEFEDNFMEYSDTISTKYEITPELRFVAM